MVALELSDEVRCGWSLATGGPSQVRRMAQRAEELGFDSLWVGDHVSFHVPILDPIALLSFAAGVTRRIRLGTAVYLLPLRHPTLIAKSTAALDVLSEGRLLLGVGVGGEFPPEFEAVGVPVGERGPRSDEAIEVVRRLWREQGVEHRGRFFDFGPVTLAPPPAQAGGPPIWVGGRKAPAFRRAGALGDGYISHMCSPEMYRENLETIAGHARKAGREGVPFETAAFLFAFPDPSYEAARARATTLLERIYRVSFEQAAPRYTLLGPPEAWLEQMARFTAAGCRHFVITALAEAEPALEQVAREVLPALGSLRP